MKPHCITKRSRLDCTLDHRNDIVLINRSSRVIKNLVDLNANRTTTGIQTMILSIESYFIALNLR